jgi:hypothetical protein
MWLFRITPRLLHGAYLRCANRGNKSFQSRKTVSDQNKPFVLRAAFDLQDALYSLSIGGVTT